MAGSSNVKLKKRKSNTHRKIKMMYQQHNQKRTKKKLILNHYNYFGEQNSEEVVDYRKKRCIRTCCGALKPGGTRKTSLSSGISTVSSSLLT